MKTCIKCNEPKDLSEFHKRKALKDGHTGECKTCTATRWKNYISKPQNKTNKREYMTGYNNRPETKEKVIARAANNKEANKEYMREYSRSRRADPYYRLQHSLRNRIWSALAGKNKSNTTMNLVGCSIDHLQAHLEKLFTVGMTWDNYGKWHCDHKVPVASFDLTDPAQQRECFNYMNLQPLWAKDNHTKGCKV